MSLVIISIAITGTACGLQNSVKGHIDVSRGSCSFKDAVSLYNKPDQRTDNPIGTLQNGTVVKISPTTEVEGYLLVDGNDASANRRIGYVKQGCVAFDEPIPDTLSISRSLSLGHIRASKECPTADAVYVYSTPRAKTRKNLGYLQDGTKVMIMLKPYTAGYYLIDGDDGDNRLHGYVYRECVVKERVNTQHIVSLTSNDVEVASAPSPPMLRSGLMRVFPLNLGDAFYVTIGGATAMCTARSTTDLNCAAPLPNFQAVIASQGGHEFLLGCQWEDSDTCVNLSVNLYSILVHDRTVTVLHSGYAKINTKTGKKISDITPVLSILAVVK